MKSNIIVNSIYSGIAWFVLLLFLASCGVNQQAKQLKALEQCKFEVESVDSLYLAGADVERLLKDGNLDVGRFAFAMMNRKLPLEGLVHLSVQNPGDHTAGVNAFQYQVLLAKEVLATGTVDARVQVKPGEMQRVAVPVKSDIYGLVKSKDVMQELVNFVSGRELSQPYDLTIRVKPTLSIANQQINYPGWITFDKKVSKELLLR